MEQKLFWCDMLPDLQISVTLPNSHKDEPLPADILPFKILVIVLVRTGTDNVTHLQKLYKAVTV